MNFQVGDKITWRGDTWTVNKVHDYCLTISNGDTKRIVIKAECRKGANEIL